MTLLDDIPLTDPPDLDLDLDLADPGPLRRADNGMSATIRLSNGQVVTLNGITRGMYYPPNYLEDLRAGRL